MKKIYNCQIQSHIDTAEKLALKEVEYRARKILVEHPTLSEFTMGMGTWNFQPEQNRSHMRFPIGGMFDNTPQYMKGLANFINKWDDTLKLTGIPMRFTATGKIHRDW